MAVSLDQGEDGVVWCVTICRAQRRNSVCPSTAAKLNEIFVKFDNDPTARVAILAGEGGNFCAGADLLSASKSPSIVDSYPMLAAKYDHTERGPMGPTRLSLSKPVIAAIEGYAVAGGLELALWCDLRVCDDTAVFGVFCRRFGVPLVDGGTVRLPRLIGESRAMDLILTGRPVDAEEAEKIGLVNRLVKRGQALSSAHKMAREIASFPQKCLRADRASARVSPWMSSSSPSVPEAEAMALESELKFGQSALEEATEGAARFSSGVGRHGQFSSTQKKESFKFAAVIFDLGGVVLDSPLRAIRELETKLGMKEFAISRIIQGAGPSGAFARLERGLLSTEEFPDAFEVDCVAAGYPPSSIPGKTLMDTILRSCRVRPKMVRALQDLRQMGLKTAALTNNFRTDIPQSNDFAQNLTSIHHLFDVVVESAIEGVRKPNPEIYRIALSRLNVPPERCIFLDDIGSNLKSAAGLGIHTIKVGVTDLDGSIALKELSKMLKMPLRNALGPSSRL